MGTFQDGDVAALGNAYKTLLDSRNGMITAVGKLVADQLRREVIVDGLILGILHHLHDVANSHRYTKELGEFGVVGYAERLAAEITNDFMEIQGGNPNPAPNAAPARNRPMKPGSR